ncbi:bifunctional DNA primase/polymerase [Pelagibius sp. CAU 1746]|uniref:bifunctional DNA primase/polymerase n=1 Tax=Pelagibius sp. CAU 1746 TaxID=3140370 RepID=UPI00325BDBB4
MAKAPDNRLSEDRQAAALAYGAAGWSVVPMAPRGKQPLLSWLEFQQRRASDEEIRDWFRRWPEANIAVVTGEISNIVVLDIDPRHGGEASLALLEDETGPIPSTVEALTGGGGRHLYFAYPGRRLRNRAGLRPGIDLRGDGGIIIVPPSVHPSGKRYTWAANHSPREADPAPLPERLRAELTARGSRQGRPLAYWRDLVAEGVPEGRRNSTIASFAGHLLWHDIDPDVVSEMLLCWNRVRCRPPLAEEEVLRTVRSITRLHEREDDSD